MRLHFVLALCVASMIFAYPQRAEADDAPAPEETAPEETAPEGTAPEETGQEEPGQESGGESILSEADIALLEKNRIVVTNEGYKQIFSAYLEEGPPLFITSDSLLGAYHVLYEESIFRLETALASRLPGILKHVLAGIDDAAGDFKGKPALVAAAKRRAKLVTGIARRLMDDSFRFKDEKLNKILEEETKRIVEAKWVGMPGWLGKPDASFTALDYSRYRPRGFYTRSERLQRYFRAVSWLQSIPFRVDKDEEFLAILMLGKCVGDDRPDNVDEAMKTGSFFGAYSSFIGTGDDWDLMTAARKAQNFHSVEVGSEDFQQDRERLKKSADQWGEGPLINDQIRFAPDDPTKVAEIGFRFIPPYRVPSAILFQRTTDQRRFKRPYPNGLEVPIALGSPFARKSLSDREDEKLLKTIESCRVYFPGSPGASRASLYLEYLGALAALLDPPEPDAPDFMKGDAWELKSCGTVLAGWAQLRHTWALQAKQTVLYMGLSRVPTGFVEPEPEFFARMAGLANRTKRLLGESGAFACGHVQAIEMLEEFNSLLAKARNEVEVGEVFREMPREQMSRFFLPLMLLKLAELEQAEDGSQMSFSKRVKWLNTVTEDIKGGRLDKHPVVKQVLDEFELDLDELWDRLERTARRLEIIAHKQLRGVDLNENETRFIRDYGKTIAGIMLYGGNSYLTPRDDAPRIIDVFSNPEAGGYLHVGVARARAIYVLYPWQGETVLCRGAVMPYYEFVASSRLTDAEWKRRLDSDDRPAIPKWAAPIVSDGKLGRPELKQDH